MRVILTVDERT